MAFRRQISSTAPASLHTRFGLRPGSLVPGAESEFCDRLSRAGLRFAYAPDAVVDRSGPGLAIVAGLLSPAPSWGGTGARAHAAEEPECKARRVLWIKPYLVRQTLESAARYAASFLQSSPQERFY